MKVIPHILLFILFITVVRAQSIVFVPEADTIKLVSGRTPPNVIFKLRRGNLSDTIKVIAGFNTMIFCDESENPFMQNETVGFICNSKNEDDLYELNIRSLSGEQNFPEIVPLDSLYENYLIGLFDVMLKVKRNDVYIDSLSQLFWGISTGLGVENNSEKIPDNFEILSVYPNPFNLSTKIIYELNRRAYVKIGVYNLLGELVELIEQNYKLAGRYELIYQAGALASGVYYIVFTASERVYSRKIALIK
ncbi:T9SS type A sorting domain-containing protein [Melioribacter sp. Ez-97]|uniref:T9SS type A sorting domain-containing protein n=1 Tax=Melioribacter sp. Ez-97 TaxID=3423434 RepID=UPI003ED9F587